MARRNRNHKSPKSPTRSPQASGTVAATQTPDANAPSDDTLTPLDHSNGDTPDAPAAEAGTPDADATKGSIRSQIRSQRPEKKTAASPSAVEVDVIRERLSAIQTLLTETNPTAETDDNSLSELLEFSDKLDAKEESLWLREAELASREADLTARRRTLARQLRAEQRRASDDKIADLHEKTTSIESILQRYASCVENIEQANVSMAAEQGTSDSEREQLTIDLQAKSEAFDSLYVQFEQQQEELQFLVRELELLRESNLELQRHADEHQSEHLFTEGQQTNLDQLTQELDDAKHRIADLEAQNKDLAAKCTDSSIRGKLDFSSGGMSESLSWEERKQLILARLENEEDSFNDDNSDEAKSTLEELQNLRQTIMQTDREIIWRDKEISELRQLLEQQSGTVGDVAIGASAIANLLDQDELVREEREKLLQIQNEWQEKLRAAEIEVSLERARLARERQNIEKRNNELEELLSDQSRETEVMIEGKPARRWLAKLGLND
ncbi:coiled-coil domain-containing protein [Roseimaritima multifibrata]|nr:hypothetical protein [Roseimaritima multifibrata]